MPKQIYPHKSITFVGSGQVAQFLATLIVNANKTLPSERQVQVSILGRKDSASLKAIRVHGITCTYPCKDKNGTVEGVIKIVSHQSTQDALNPSKITSENTVDNNTAFVTDNPEEIAEKFGPQDHIFIVTKTYSHTKALVVSHINPLRQRTSNDTRKSSIILAQNGIPCWILHGIPAFEKIKNTPINSVDILANVN